MTVLGSFPRRRKKNKKVDGKVYNNSDNNEGDKLLSVLRRRQIPTWQVTEFINSPFSCVLKNKLKCGYKYRRKYEFYFLLELWRENKLEFPTPASTIDLSNESEFLCKGIQFNFLFSTLIYLNIMRRGGYCQPASSKQARLVVFSEEKHFLTTRIYFSFPWTISVLSSTRKTFFFSSLLSSVFICDDGWCCDKYISRSTCKQYFLSFFHFQHFKMYINLFNKTNDLISKCRNHQLHCSALRHAN